MYLVPLSHTVKRVKYRMFYIMRPYYNKKAFLKKELETSWQLPHRPPQQNILFNK